MPGSSPCSLCQIYYWEADGQNETEKMKVLFLPETTVKLKNLSSHTSYLVSVSAFNAAGDGPRSGPRQGRTHQAGRRTARSFRSPSQMLPLGATARSCPPPRGCSATPSVPPALGSARPVTQTPGRLALLGLTHRAPQGLASARCLELRANH